jgi:formylmethanofuran dehydrogenase subunit E
MAGKDLLSREDFKKCAEFHGHVCPGLALGYRAAKAGLDRLKMNRASDEELAVVIETDACGADAIQVLTGCTIGKGNLIIKDYGKQVITLFGRESGEGIRMSMIPGKISISDRHRELIKKITDETATEDERREFDAMHLQRTREVLEKPLEELFRIEAATIQMPAKARVEPSVPCDRCGEPTMSTKLIEKDGEKLCGECVN